MKKRYECLGLQGLTERPALQEHILAHTNYTVPGYGCNYVHCDFPDDVEFQFCFRGGKEKPEAAGVDLHFKSDACRTYWFDSAVDTASTAHKYLVRKEKNGKELLPMRIICPDVLARPQPGDEMYGQVIAFVQQAWVWKGGHKASGAVYAIDGDAVNVSGRISDIHLRRFRFQELQCDFFELDVETELGMITLLAKEDALDEEPQMGGCIIAKAYISMDVAILPEESQERPFYEEATYPDLPGDTTRQDYRNGFVPDHSHAVRVLTDAAARKDAFRFGRCCADEVLFSDTTGEVQPLQRWAAVEKLEDILAGAGTIEEVLTVADAAGTQCFQGGVLLDHEKYLVVDTNEDGFVDRVTLLPAEDYVSDTDTERYLLGILANALCFGKVRRLEAVLSDCCTYRSDYAEKREYGVRDIVNSINRANAYTDASTACRYELIPTEQELLDEEKKDLPRIFSGNWCFRLFQGDKNTPVAVGFLRYNDNGEITRILLSRNSGHLRSFAAEKALKDEPQEYPRVDTLLQQTFGQLGTVSDMRYKSIHLADTAGAYVWQKADRYIQDWFFENGYRMDSTELFEDCIGYACTRRGEEYAVYVYAYGEQKTSVLDGDYCARLRDYTLSKDRTILVIYLHVSWEENDDGEIIFHVGRFNSKDDAPEVWTLGWIGERSALLYYPRKEIADLGRRLMAAYNARRLDILKALLTEDAFLEDLEGGMNDAVCSSLAYHREHDGVMKTAYLRLHDAVYSEVPYIEELCYINFTVTPQDRISSIRFHPLDESVWELYLTDEVLMYHPADDVPPLKKVEFLPPSDRSRFSMLLTFMNGETRRYYASGDFGSDDVVVWRKTAFTDKMFRNGRITDPVCAEKARFCQSYPQQHQGVEFINGASVSTVELYHNSYPVGAFQYRDGAEIWTYTTGTRDGITVGRIRGLDPTDPLYLLDTRAKTATLLPEKFQKTPTICYSSCVWYMEELIMVSTMGELELQHPHARAPYAGMWGWLDTNLNTVIEPKYVYALNFANGRAIVCKGSWDVAEKDGKRRYWCSNEQWGVIDKNEQEIVPCRFDEVYEIFPTDRLYFVHEGGWENGHYAIYDVQEQRVILELDFDFNMAYMFNVCRVEDDNILVFMDYLSDETENLLYAYDLRQKKCLAYAEGFTYNRQGRVVVNRDGRDIIVF